MIKKGDIFHYTAEVGSGTKYFIDEVYEAQEEYMVIFSWEDVNEDTRWKRVVRSLKELMEILQSGHIVIVGSEEYKPITNIRPHTFNPIPRDLMTTHKFKCPYRTPKLYEWNHSPCRETLS
jgi:hypothetical protein